MAKKSKRGRPTLNGHRGSESPALHVRLPADVLAALKTRARNAGKRLSEFVREAIVAFARKG